MALVVRGLRELNQTFKAAPKDYNKAYRAELRTVANPTKTDAERLAVQRIRKVGPVWSRMRVGITQRLVYVAPRPRGVKGRGRDRARRPNFGTLLMERAMDPALQENQEQIARDFDRMLDRLVTKWDHDGP